ncbi:MAG: glycosyl transferase family protein [uncultured bacterium]|nr:MAG: glycosyl transferase family protein [uncultured bacterium]
MYEGKSVSVVFATYKEKKSIRKAIDDFLKTGFVDEVVVVNNNAEIGTNDEVKKTKAKLFHETHQGYGYAFQKAILSATGDYIIVCEPDGTFKASDIERFLIYSRDFDVVIGTRTSQIGALSGEGMGIFRKFANVIEAKTIEVLFNSVALTDVGCAYKFFKRSALNKIKPLWRNQKTALFNTELTLLTVALGIKFVEIPITYSKRVGKSQIVGRWHQVAKWAIVIQLYIIFFWLDTKINPRKYKH